MSPPSTRIKAAKSLTPVAMNVPSLGATGHAQLGADAEKPHFEASIKIEDISLRDRVKGCAGEIFPAGPQRARESCAAVPATTALEA